MPSQSFGEYMQSDWQNMDEIVFSILWSMSFFGLLLFLFRTKIFFNKPSIHSRHSQIDRIEIS